MKEYAGKFHELIKKQGAKTVLFMTWARQDKPATQRRIAIAYEETAKELGATVVPVGLAWQKARSASKPFTLHAADKSHPNEQGSYLTACVFFGTLDRSENRGPAGPARLQRQDAHEHPHRRRRPPATHSPARRSARKKKRTRKK